MLQKQNSELSTNEEVVHTKVEESKERSIGETRKMGNPWKRVKALKRCDTDLLFSCDLSKSVDHKFVSFALNLLCVSRKYDLIFISYGSYIYIYELNEFLDKKVYANEKRDHEKSHVMNDFNKREIGKSNYGFTNINKVRNVYEDVKRDYHLNKFNVPAPSLIVSSYAHSKGYVNIKCEEKDEYDKSILISVGWSEDTSVYYVDKIVECINIKKKIKHILEKKIYDCKRYEDSITSNVQFPFFPFGDPLQNFAYDPYHFLKKIKMDEDNVVLNLIYNSEHRNIYSGEYVDMFELSKNINNFDYVKNKKNSLLNIKKKNMHKSGVYKTWNFEKGSHKENSNKRGLYKINYKCMLKCPKDGSKGFFRSSIQHCNFQNTNYTDIRKKKFRISDIYSSLESAEEEEEEEEEIDGIRLRAGNETRGGYKKKKIGENVYRHNLGDSAREIEEISFYQKVRNDVYLGYNLRNNLGLNEHNNYINSVREENEFVNEYIKSSSEDEKHKYLRDPLKSPWRKKGRYSIKFYGRKALLKCLKEKNDKGKKKTTKNNCTIRERIRDSIRENIRESIRESIRERIRGKIQSRIKQRIEERKKKRENMMMQNRNDNNCNPSVVGTSSTENPNLSILSGKPKMSKKKDEGITQKKEVNILNRNIRRYMSNMRRLNRLKEERKKFVNFCKSHVKRKHNAKYSKKLEIFLDPSVNIKYNKIWKSLNKFTFNLFNFDYNDKILKSARIYVQPDIVFNNKMNVKSDNSTWAISFNFTKNLLAIGSNTHNINIYNLNNFYYFRKRYNFDEAMHFFKNVLLYRKFKTNNLFRNEEEHTYFFFNSDEDDPFLKKKKKKNGLLYGNKNAKSYEQVIHLNLFQKKKSDNRSNVAKKVSSASLKNKTLHRFPLVEDGKRKKGNELVVRDEKCCDKKKKETYTNCVVSDVKHEQGRKKGEEREKKKKKTEGKNNVDVIRLDNRTRDNSTLMPGDVGIWKKCLTSCLKKEDALHEESHHPDGHFDGHFENGEKGAKAINTGGLTCLPPLNGEHLSDECVDDNACKKEAHTSCGGENAFIEESIIHAATKERQASRTEDSSILHTSKRDANNHGDAHVNRVLNNILTERSTIPVEFTAFFLKRREFLKDILLTVASNFPSDSIIYFLNEAHLGQEIYRMKFYDQYDLRLTINEMKALYFKRYSSSENLNLKLFNRNTVLINNEKSLKELYLKYLRKNVFTNFKMENDEQNRKDEEEMNSITPKGCMKRKYDHLKSEKYVSDVKQDGINKNVSSKYIKKKEKKNEIVNNNEKMKLIIEDLYHENTSDDDTFREKDSILYNTKKSYSFVEKEKQYALVSYDNQNSHNNANDINSAEDNERVVLYTHVYSYKNANLVLKRISKKFRKFIKNRHNFVFTRMNQLYSNEHSILVVLDKKRSKKKCSRYDHASGKYIEELKTVVTNIRRYTMPNLCIEGERGHSKKGEVGEEDLVDKLAKKKTLVICELRDHNNNILDTVHLTNEPVEEKLDCLTDRFSSEYKEGETKIYYSFLFDDDDIRNYETTKRNKKRVKNDLNEIETKLKQISGIKSDTRSIRHMSGIINYTIDMEMKEICKHKPTLFIPKIGQSTKKEKSVTSSSSQNLIDESETSSSQLSDEQQDNGDYRMYQSFAHLNSGNVENGDNDNNLINDGLTQTHTQILRNGYNSDVSSGGHLLVRALRNFRILRNNFQSDDRNSAIDSRRNHDNIAENFTNDDAHRLINTMVNATQNILNINNTENNMNNGSSHALSHGDNFSNVDVSTVADVGADGFLNSITSSFTVYNPEIGLGLMPSVTEERTSRPNASRYSAGNITTRNENRENGDTHFNEYTNRILNDLFRRSSNGNTGNFEAIISISNEEDANVGAQRSASSINNNRDGILHFRELQNENDHMFLDIIYNNVLNTGDSNGNTPPPVYLSIAPTNENIVRNIIASNSGEIDERSNLLEGSTTVRENNSLLDQVSGNTSTLNVASVDRVNAVEDSTCKKESNGEKVDVKGDSKANGTLFREVPFSLKHMCENERYEARIRYIYTLSRSADEILLSYGSSSELAYDFVIICEGFYEENFDSTCDADGEGGNDEKKEVLENELGRRLEEEEGVTEHCMEGNVFNWETLHRIIERQAEGGELSPARRANRSSGGTGESGACGAYLMESSFFPLGTMSTFSNCKNAYGSSGHQRSVISSFDVGRRRTNCADSAYGEDSDLSENSYEMELLMRNCINAGSKKKKDPISTSSRVESSDFSYHSSTSNTSSDFSMMSASSDSDCSRYACYSNLYLENDSNTVNFNSTYHFLKNENCILHVENCKVEIKGDKKGTMTKYCLKRKGLKRETKKKKKKNFEENTKIVTLRIKDFQYDCPGCTENEDGKRDREEKTLLSLGKKIKMSTGEGHKCCRDDHIVKSKWLHKILLQQNYYEIAQEKLPVCASNKEACNRSYQLDVTNIVKIEKFIEDFSISKGDDRLKTRPSRVFCNKVGRKKSTNKGYIRKHYNCNVSSLIHFKGEEIRKYFYNEKNVKYFESTSNSFAIKDNFLKKLKDVVLQTNKNLSSEILWTLSNVTFYTADWYDILHKILFEMTTRFYEIVVKHHVHNIPCVKFSPDDNFLLSCSVDKSVVLWNPFNANSYDVEKNYNIYDHIFPPRGRIIERDKLGISSGTNKWLSNVFIEINYARRKNVFDSAFHQTKMYKVQKEKELMGKVKGSNIVCKQKLEYMGWSGDFILKKNIKKFDFLVDLFHKQEPRPSEENFNHSVYFPFGGVHLYDFLPLLEKYSLFQLFRCSFAGGLTLGGGTLSRRNDYNDDIHYSNVQKRDMAKFCKVADYLYRVNTKKAECLEESTVRNVLEIMTAKNLKNVQLNSRKKRRRVYVAMRYVFRNLLKPYILVCPINGNNCYDRKGKVRLTEGNLRNATCVLTDYDIAYSSSDERTFRNFKGNVKCNRFEWAQRKEKKKREKLRFASHYENSLDHNAPEENSHPDSYTSWSPNEKGKKKKKKISNRDNESDEDYQKRSKYEKSLFHKYICKIRNNLKSTFSLKEERDYKDALNWFPMFQKLLRQYAEMRHFKGIYNNIKEKIVKKCIRKYEELRPTLHFNFHVTTCYQEAKILNELLLNYTLYFGKNRANICATGVGTQNGMPRRRKRERGNKRFKSYLKLIRRERLLVSDCRKKEGGNLVSANEANPSDNGASQSKGYTLILKNNVANFHNVVHNIVHISNTNGVINHHKFFKKNGYYGKSDHGANGSRCDKRENRLEGKRTKKRDHKTGVTQLRKVGEYTRSRNIFEKFFDDFDEEKADVHSSESLSSYRSEARHGWKKKSKHRVGQKSGKRNPLRNRQTITRGREEVCEAGYRNGIFSPLSSNLPKKGDLEEVLRRERKKFNVCFLSSKKESYKINYFQNVNILQSMYRFCGRGLIIVNVQYVTKDEGGPEKGTTGNQKGSSKNLPRRASQRTPADDIIFQTDIHICKEHSAKTSTGGDRKKRVSYKNTRIIIFIVRVNMEALRSYIRRKLIFEAKYIKSSLYINVKIAKVLYFITLHNCKSLNRDRGIYCKKMDVLKKGTLKELLSKDQYAFFTYLTKNIFKDKRKNMLRKKFIHVSVMKMRCFIFNEECVDVPPNMVQDILSAGAAFYQYKNNTLVSSPFQLFFVVLPARKKNMIMLNISTLRFLYSYMGSEEGKMASARFSRSVGNAKDMQCWAGGDKEEHLSIVSREEKKQLNKYLILSADKCKLYLLKIKFTKITNNLFSTKFVPILVQSIPKGKKIAASFNSSRISFLKIIYEKSCILLANQYSNIILIYFLHKCVYTDSYFLIPYFSLPLYTERIGKEIVPNFRKDVSPCSFRRHLINNVNYNLKRLLIGSAKDIHNEENFFIAGFDVMYVKGKKDNFELTVFAVLLSNVIFCYKLSFHYY
ncbi:WD repeat-containing protein, putative [Plasmodium ovale curtisi]|uniref:WD repeat-containing protein, putative n=1 Tax=Plasmodium ovale curtisi TaxID=864141 RepID=A0A1A8X1Y4_PLAOA|nr:WD repeat-containing protein, putative [Plasmodium ovale curtisi]